jgi:hypothetical protein
MVDTGGTAGTAGTAGTGTTGARTVTMTLEATLPAVMSTISIPGVLPTCSVAVAFPWAFVAFCVTVEPIVASSPGWAEIMNVHVAPTTGLPPASSAVHVMSTWEFASGLASSAVAVTLPTTGGYWAEVLPLLEKKTTATAIVVVVANHLRIVLTPIHVHSMLSPLLAHGLLCRVCFCFCPVG